MKWQTTRLHEQCLWGEDRRSWAELRGWLLIQSGLTGWLGYDIWLFDSYDSYPPTKEEHQLVNLTLPGLAYAGFPATEEFL
jgi:hypothetical protein